MRVVQTIDLPVNADAVEYYRDAGRDLVACGMYELVKEERIGCIQLFEFLNEELRQIASVDTSGVFDMKWNNRGVLGASCADGTIALFNTKLQNVCTVEVAPSAFCLALAWLGESNTVAVSSSNGTITLCDVETETVTNQFAAHSYPHDAQMPAEIWTIAASGDGNMLASGADEGALKLWDARSPGLLISAKRGVHQDCGVCSLLFAEDGKLLYSGGYDGNVRAWDMSLPRSNAFVASTEQALGGGIWRIKQGGHNLLLTACMRGGFQTLHRDTLQPVHKYTEEEPQWEALAYGADWIGQQEQARFAAGCSFYDKKLRLFTLASG